jgi:ribonuclease III, bacterial
MTELMAKIGYVFKDAKLLKLALTHPSLGVQDNQRLEFLGDAVLQFLMSEKLYSFYPKEREGGLTHRRATLVCEAALSEIARQIGLGECIKMDKGEEMTHGREKSSILADAMEALLAAVYLDGGMESAKAMFNRLWPDLSKSPSAVTDYKGALQEHLQSKGLLTPTYELIGQEGPPHDRLFTAAVFSNGEALSRGTGKTKKQAEQEAAMAALDRLRG